MTILPNPGDVATESGAHARPAGDSRSSTAQAEAASIQIEPGDEVIWSSHGGGGRTTKRGRVVIAVAPGEGIEALKAELSATHDVSPVMLSGQGRSERSFLVEVPATTTRKPKLYWPNTTSLARCADKTLTAISDCSHRTRQTPLFRVPPVRTLLDGRCIQSSMSPTPIPLITCAPEKWALLDMETGEAYSFADKRFQALDPATRATAATILSRPPPATVRGQHRRRRPLPSPAGKPPTKSN